MLGDDEVVSDELASVLTLRNDLVHHWMRERALDQGTSKRRREMVEELDSAIEQLEAADARLVERTQHLLEQVGVSKTLIQAEYKRLRAVAASGNSANVMRDFEVMTKAHRK
jgi:G:T/U-mismatch repair DNA glycosylase